MNTLQEYFEARLNEANTTGSLLVCYEAGRCLELGLGTPLDKQAAENWYRHVFDNGGLSVIRALAEKGEAQAQFILGRVYFNGQAGLSANDNEAVKWYRAAAEQGYAIAQSSLGFMYSNGRGVAKNDAEAVKWYRAAVNSLCRMSVSKKR